jgi:hypothetical protein
MGRISLGILVSWLFTAVVAEAQTTKLPDPVSPPPFQPFRVLLGFDDRPKPLPAPLVTQTNPPPLAQPSQKPPDQSQQPPQQPQTQPLTGAPPAGGTVLTTDPPPPTRFYGSADYLLWWIRASNTPPLVTIGPPTAGAILGQTGTVTAFDGFGNNNPQSGGRFLLGAWLNDAQTVGIEGSFFFLGAWSDQFSLFSPAGVTVARPFINNATGAEDSELVSVPGRLNGNVIVSQATRLWGAEVNGVANLLDSPAVRFDGLAGFRFLDLEERLRIEEHLLVPTGAAGIGGNRFDLQDRFHTANRFYGGQVGGRGELRYGPWALTATAKVALGCTEEVANIRGSTLFTPAGGAGVLQNGGLLALPSNSGRFTRDVFAVVPEVGVNLALQVAPWLRLQVGYTFLYWSDVARPGTIIDRTVSPQQVPVAGQPGGVGTRPGFAFRDTDFWAQGINFGVEIRY